MESTHALESIPDDDLLRRLADLLDGSRHTEADVVAHIGEVDARRLYAREATPSMHAYCTERLHLSDAEAYLRIAAARASREHPVILEMLADGRLHLTAIAKLAPHLTRENRESLLKQATHKTRREVEELLAELEPRPDTPALIRKLPEPRLAAVRSSGKHPTTTISRGPHQADPSALPGQELRLDGVVSDRSDGMESQLPAASETKGLPFAVTRPSGGPTIGRARPSVIEPLAPARYRVQFTASAALRDKLERLRALLRSSIPDGDLAAIIEQAVTEKLERLESRRFGGTSRKAAPAGSSAQGRASKTGAPPVTRHVPAAIRRSVHERDGERCSYEDDQGRRCSARERLEFHHRHPFGFGGDHSVEQISIVCKAHNRYLAEID